MIVNKQLLLLLFTNPIYLNDGYLKILITNSSINFNLIKIMVYKIKYLAFYCDYFMVLTTLSWLKFVTKQLTHML